MAAQKEKKLKYNKNLGGLNIQKGNIIIFFIAILTIMLGYYFTSIGPFDSTSSLTIGPVILVIGYVILIPLSILWNKIEKKDKK